MFALCTDLSKFYILYRITAVIRYKTVKIQISWLLIQDPLWDDTIIWFPASLLITQMRLGTSLALICIQFV